MMCSMNRDFIVFMREHCPQVANEQFEFGTIFSIEDNEVGQDEHRTVNMVVRKNKTISESRIGSANLPDPQ